VTNIYFLYKKYLVSQSLDNRSLESNNRNYAHVHISLAFRRDEAKFRIDRALATEIQDFIFEDVEIDLTKICT